MELQILYLTNMVLDIYLVQVWHYRSDFGESFTFCWLLHIMLCNIISISYQPSHNLSITTVVILSLFLDVIPNFYNYQVS